MVKCDFCGTPNAKTFRMGGVNRRLCVWHQKKYGMGVFREKAAEHLWLDVPSVVMEEVFDRMRQERVSDRNIFMVELVRRGLTVVGEKRGRT